MRTLARVPLLLALLVLPACDVGVRTENLRSDPAIVARDHPFFPLTAGTQWRYVGTKDGAWHEELVRVDDEPRVIDGVVCTPLVQEVRIDGALDHVTTEWFAVDADGNVFKFGEQALDFGGERAEPVVESWFAGEGGAFAWRYLAASPSPGDEVLGYSTEGTERVTVLRSDATDAVAAGTFTGCIEVDEEHDDPKDADIVLYAPGVGRTSETSAGGRIELVERRSPR
jgi:hypothetical protein